MRESKKVNEILILVWNKCDIKNTERYGSCQWKVMNCSSRTDCLFLGTFTKFEKRILVLLCLSVHLHGTTRFPLQDIENLNFNIFRKCAKMIQASLMYDKNNRYFVWRRMYIYDNM